MDRAESLKSFSVVPELVALLTVTSIFMRCLSVRRDFLRVSIFRFRVKRCAFRSFARPAKHNLCGRSWARFRKQSATSESEDLTQVACAKCQKIDGRHKAARAVRLSHRTSYVTEETKRRDACGYTFSITAPKDNCQRCPNLPHSHPCSTIGPAKLNYRVRDGNG